MPADDALYGLDLMRQRRDLDIAFFNYRYGPQPRPPWINPKFAKLWSSVVENYTVNVCAPTVTAKANRLEIDSWDGSDDANRYWTEQGGSSTQNDVHPDAITSGDAYLLVWPAVSMDGPLRWNPLRSDEAIVVYSDDDPERVDYGLKMWIVEERGRTRKARVRVNLLYPDRVERYISQPVGGSGIGSVRDRSLDFEQIVDGRASLAPYDEDGLDSTFNHPFDQVPLVHFRNGKGRDRRYGWSDLYHVIPLQDEINSLGFNLIAASEVYGLPLRVLLGYALEDWDGDGKPDNLPKVDPRNDPFLVFPGINTRVEQLSPADLAQLSAELGRAIEQVSMVTSVPPHIFLRQGGNPPSGEALRIVESPLIADSVTKQQDFGPSWSKVMALSGFADVQPVWGDPSSMDVMEEWELVQKKVEAGWPARQAFIELGVDPDTVDEVLAAGAAMERNAGSLLMQAQRDGRDPVELLRDSQVRQ
jgi:hypothetical protein